MRKKSPLFLWGILTATLFPAEVAHAVEPGRWVFSTPEEFLQGELKGVSVSSDGRLVLAPAFEPTFDTEEGFIFSAVADRTGNIYLGTGNDGRIFRLTPSGEAGQWAKLDEVAVQALAVDSNDRIYAATSPDGKVYRLGSRGEAEVFFDPGQKYIWALAVDAQNNVYVGTGPQGTIYRVTAQGRDSVFYDSPSTHIVSLEWDLEGYLLAGSSPGARLYRISPQGRGLVIFASPLEEMKAITVDRYGVIYAAALGAPRPGEATPPPAPPSAAPQRQTGNEDPSSSSANDATTIRVAGTQRGRKLEIYRVDREGLVETIYTANEEMAFDLLVRPDGNLLVATGDRGRILSIDPRRFVTLLVESGEEQVTRLLDVGGRIYAATSNLGKVFQLLPQPSQSGVYESKPQDAGLIASWGRIRWHVHNPSGSGVRVYTRSGNTDPPDSTWSDWSGPYADPQGTPTDSPPARYLQWKIEFPQAGRPATLITDSNAVEMVVVHYLQQNMAPRVSSITVHPPGVAFARFPSANPGGGVSPGGPDGAHLRSLPRSVRALDRAPATPPPRKVYIPGAQSISWTAEDPNGDDLVFTLHYRRKEDSTWKVLKADLTENEYTLDGVSFPDGTYFVKVVASDRPSNPPTSALESELISSAFVIANTTPTIEFATPRVEGRRATLEFTARTRASTVHRAEYQLDAGAWQIAFPVDGVPDSEEERYRLTLDDLAPGTRALTVRVVDSVGNIGTGTVRLSVN